MKIACNIRMRMSPLAAVLAFCLALAVSCAKKPEEAEVQAPQAAPRAAELQKPVAEAEVEQTVETAVATIEVIAAPAADTVKKAPRKAPAPVPAAEPAEPLPPPEPQPTLVLVQIAGPKVITAGQMFSLTADADGGGKAHGYAWNFRSGKDVIETKTDGAKVTTTLNKAGEWTVTCKIMWQEKVISSMVIKINVNAAAAE